MPATSVSSLLDWGVYFSAFGMLLLVFSGPVSQASAAAQAVTARSVAVGTVNQLNALHSGMSLELRCPPFGERLSFHGDLVTVLVGAGNRSEETRWHLPALDRVACGGSIRVSLEGPNARVGR
jgi:hypothetical protein